MAACGMVMTEGCIQPAVGRKLKKRKAVEADGSEVIVRRKKKWRRASSGEIATHAEAGSVPRPPARPEKPSPWEWWTALGKPRHIMSPMVGQSELAFRKLCRRHGTTLCYTPMLISKAFIVSAGYRRRLMQTCPGDRPLIAQFCGNDPRTLVQAALMVQDQVDAVDLNLGCPQTVAQRGNYGAWLMDKDWGLLREIVGSMARALSVPVTCKIRRFEDEKRTVAYARMLQDAGASLLTLHPRQRHEKEETFADWSFTACIKQQLQVPIIGNGDVYHAEDAWLYQRQTGVDGVMCAQGLLYNPALFEPLMKKGLEAGPTAKHLSSQCTPNVKMPVKESLPSHMRCRRPLSPYLAFRISGMFKRQPLVQSQQEQGRAASTVAKTEDLVLPGSSSTFMSTPEDVEKQFALAKEYLRHCFDENGQMHPAITPCHPSVIRRHLFFILFDTFQANCDLIDELSVAGGQLDKDSLRPDSKSSSDPAVQGGQKATAKAQWKAKKKEKLRVFTDSKTGKRYNLPDRYWRETTAKPYLDVIDKLRERAERGTPHPAALAAVNQLKANGKPRARRRNGSFAPPEWPVGGGGFHVARANQAEDAVAPAEGAAVATRAGTAREEKKTDSNGSTVADLEDSSIKRKLSKAERKRMRSSGGAHLPGEDGPPKRLAVSSDSGQQVVNASDVNVDAGGKRKLSKAERKQQKSGKK